MRVNTPRRAGRGSRLHFPSPQPATRSGPAHIDRRGGGGQQGTHPGLRPPLRGGEQYLSPPGRGAALAAGWVCPGLFPCGWGAGLIPSWEGCRASGGVGLFVSARPAEQTHPGLRPPLRGGEQDISPLGRGAALAAGWVCPGLLVLRLGSPDSVEWAAHVLGGMSVKNITPETIGTAHLSRRPVNMDLAIRKQPLTLVFDQPVFVLPGHGHPAAALLGG